MKKTSRTKRFNLRATARQEKLIRMVAKIQGMNVTEFILESACEQAEMALADRKHFIVSPSQYNAFVKALERPAQEYPELKRLLTEPSILEGGS